MRNIKLKELGDNKTVLVMSQKRIESLPLTLIFNPHIFASLCRTPYTFSTMNQIIYKFEISRVYTDCKDIGIGKIQFVSKTPFL